MNFVTKALIAIAIYIPCVAFSIPAQVIIVRHGEKPSSGSTLELAGQERSGAFAFYFQNNPFVLDFGLPVAIFATNPKTPTSSTREIRTMTPLAKALSMTLHTPFINTEVEQLAKLILNEPAYHGKMVLICWDHTQMGALAKAFGVSPEPSHYPDNRFDLVYKITYPKLQPTPTFCIGLQKLMFDDSATPPDGFPLCSQSN